MTSDEEEVPQPKIAPWDLWEFWAISVDFSETEARWVFLRERYIETITCKSNDFTEEVIGFLRRECWEEITKY